MRTDQGMEILPDRNRITGAGVTAGIDVALVIAARTGSDDLAREIQLNIECDPHPAFRSGLPRTADPNLVERVAESRRAFQDKRREQIRKLQPQIPRK